MEADIGAASYPIPHSARPERQRKGAWQRLRSTVTLLFAATLACLSVGCQSTPVTGRKALNFFSPQDDVALGREAYAQILEGADIVRSGRDFDMVNRCMQRLVAVADDPGFEWEVTLIRDDATANAFALPGGKMAVYTGILPICQSEAGLAVVMGHEIGHVVAQHGTERMSRSMPLEVALGMIDAGEYAQLAAGGIDLLLNRPHGRSQESESDHIGLIYMARAGYDPREAVAFWQRMNDLSSGAPPEFLSTHPSHERRIQDLQDLMPQALAELEGTGAAP